MDFILLPHGGGRISFYSSPPDDLLLAVVVSSLDVLGHVSQGAEAWLSSQSVGGQGLETPARCLSFLQSGKTSDVLPADQSQCVLQIALPQCCLRDKSTEPDLHFEI